MDLREAITSRRSIRAYSAEPVARDVIEDLIHLAEQAPSSMNSQPWHFHVATGEARSRVVRIVGSTTKYLEEYLRVLSPEELEVAEEFFADLGHAPVVIAVSVPSLDEEPDRTNALLATGGAIQSLQLAARDKGLGSCCITFSWWVREDLSDVFLVPADREIVALVLLGAPAEVPQPPGRNGGHVDFVE